MAGGRQRGGGSPRIDWAAALAFWLGLGEERTYGKVSREFGVSDTAVGKHARAHGWPEKALEVDAKAMQQALARGVRSREDRIVKALEIVDLVLDHAGEDLFGEDGESPRVRASYERVPEFVKLAELLSGEATDRVSFEELQTALRTVLRVTGPFVPKAKREEWIEAVNAELGAGE